MDFNQSPTLARTNLHEVTPERLSGKIDYSIFNKMAEFEHRGHEFELDRMISYIGAGISNKAIEADQDTIKTFSEREAVNIALDAIEGKFGGWFDIQQIPDQHGKVITTEELSIAEIRDEYWAGMLNPKMEDVGGDNWSDHKRVIIPLLAIVLGKVRNQMGLDQSVQAQAAKSRIKRVIVKEARENNLTAQEVNKAINHARRTLRVM